MVVFRVPAWCENAPGTLQLSPKRLVWHGDRSGGQGIARKLTAVRSVTTGKPRADQRPRLYVRCRQTPCYVFELASQTACDRCLVQIRQAAEARKSTKALPDTARPAPTPGVRRDPSTALPSRLPLEWDRSTQQLQLTPRAALWVLEVHPELKAARDRLVPDVMTAAVFWGGVLSAPPVRPNGNLLAAHRALQPTLRALLTAASPQQARCTNQGLRPDIEWPSGLGCDAPGDRSARFRKASRSLLSHSQGVLGNMTSALQPWRTRPEHTPCGNKPPVPASSYFEDGVLDALRRRRW